MLGVAGKCGVFFLFIYYYYYFIFLINFFFFFFFFGGGGLAKNSWYVVILIKSDLYKHNMTDNLHQHNKVILKYLLKGHCNQIYQGYFSDEKHRVLFIQHC